MKIISFFLFFVSDEILLVIKRTHIEKDVCHHLTEECCRGPSEEEIKAATMSVEEKNAMKIRPIVECTADVSQSSLVVHAGRPDNKYS